MVFLFFGPQSVLSTHVTSVIALWQHLSHGPEACSEQNERVDASPETLQFKESA